MTRPTSWGMDGKIKTVCSLCEGTGWIIRQDEDCREYCSKCDCGILKNSPGQKSLSHMPDRFSSVRLSQFLLDIYQQRESRELAEFAYSCVQCWLRDFMEMQKKGMGLYLFSSTPGSGKTLMAACLANELMHEYGKAVRFYTSMDIIEEITKSWDKLSDLLESDLLRKFREVDILVIDDFGIERQTDWIEEKFYQIINARCASKKITIFTSNLSVDDLKHDVRTKSRIKAQTYQLPFPEESIREDIAHANMNDMMQRAKEFRKKNNEQLSLPL